MGKENRQFKMFSLFDGSGGFPLAATLCGIEPVGCSEIEPFPIKVTRARFPNMKHYGDISKINGAELEPVDLVTGGSPCQSLSLAGKRDGISKKCLSCGHKVLATEESDICPECGGVMAYTRSGLFMEQIRVIKEMREEDELRQLRMRGTVEHIRPRFMLWENVTGAFSSNKGEDFRAVIEETARIVDKTAVIPRPPKGKWNNAGYIMGDGYSIAWRVLDAQYWGVPQRRRRIALVADFGGQCAGEILFKREGLQRNFTESRHAWQSLTGCATDSIGEAGECQPSVLDMTHANDVIREYKDGICPTLQHRMGTGGNQVPLTMQVRCGKEGGGKGALIQHDLSATLSTSNIQTLFQPKKAYGIGAYNSEGMKSDNPNSGIYEAETARTLDFNGGNPACNQGGVAICEPIGFDGYNQTQTGDKTNTLTCQRTDASNNPIVFEHKKAFRMEAFGQYSESDIAFAMKARDYKDATDIIIEPEYIVRRLTPLECSRLQGFPDTWVDGIEIPEPTEEDLQFWREVFETHREVVTKAKKPKTDKQIIKWLKEPDTDGAKYKLYGNGIALPCFLYVMEGIREVLDREENN